MRLRLVLTVALGGLAASAADPFRHLPLIFEPNQGQTDAAVRYVLQVNARVPAAVVPGNAVPVTVAVSASATSPPGVTIAVR